MSGSASSTDSEPVAGGSTRVLALSIASGTSTAGSVLNVIAVLSFTYAITGSPIPVGLTVIAGFLPVALLMPFIGRWLPVGAERRTMLVAVLAQAVGAGLMAWLSGTAALVPMFLLVAVMGLLAMITRISLLCLLPQVVGPAALPSANVWLQVSAQTGAGVGAGVLAIRGDTAAWVLFGVDAVSFLLQATLLAKILPTGSAPEPTAAETGSPPHRLASSRWIFVLALLPAGFVAMNLLNAAMPIMAFDSLGLGQRGLAAAEVVYPVTAVLLGILVHRRRRIRMPITLGGLVAGFAVLAVADRMSLFLLGVGVLGAAVVLSNAATQAWVQSTLPRSHLAWWQSRAAAGGATVSAIGVLTLSYGFTAQRQGIVLAVVALLFLALAWLAVLAERRTAAWS